MKPISILLILSMPAIALVIRNYHAITGKVAARALYVLFSVMVVVAVIFPDLTQRLAQGLGVGRGADLIFYATTLSLIAVSGLMVVKTKAIDNRFVLIVRAQALKDFEQTMRPPPVED